MILPYFGIFVSLVLLLNLILFQRWGPTTQALEFCSIQDGGGGICPTGNTCCPFYTVLSPSLPEQAIKTYLSACIPNDLGSYNATCCHDGIVEFPDSTNPSTGSIVATTSGCPVGYTCATDCDGSDCSDRKERRRFCLANETFIDIDPLLTVLPRYPIHPCPQIQNVYGFSGRNVSNLNNRKLAYYSSHGDIQNLTASTTNDWKKSIRHVLIVIHGANRNADDYFCSLHAIVQQQMNPSEILLLVPWFVSTSDRVATPLVNGGEPFRWDTTRDVSGPWRYGANAVSSSSISLETSSFALLDDIISYILDSTNRPQFENLQRLVVAGHSSGGQFVQRWSMLTHTWDDQRMKSVVANPSSYAYLTPMRHLDTEWRLPNSDELFLCPDYNEWEWGIGTVLFRPQSIATNPPTGRSFIDIVPPYVQNALARYGSVHNVSSIFSMRDVTYLVGGLDVCNIPDTKQPNGWCNSHGLESSCRDTMQGSNRLERHHWYCASLQRLNVSHYCLVVPNVGHDHSLMFNSEIGVSALFGRHDSMSKIA